MIVNADLPPRSESAAPDKRAAETPFWVTRRAARRALIALHAAGLTVVLIEIVIPLAAHDDHGAERLAALDFAGSYAIYGFVACVVLVLLGRVLRRFVMRDERYYDRDPKDNR